MEIMHIDKLSKGLYLSGEGATIPQGYLQVYRGISALSIDVLLSRDGSTKIHALFGTPHSLIYFNSMWYIGLSTSLYEETTELITGLSGDRLSFAVMAPIAGIDDYLFLAGGDALYKIDQGSNYWTWGIAPPEASPTLTDGGAGGNLDDGAIYKYAVTFLNSTTGHRSNPNSAGDLEITSDYKVLLHFDGADASTTIENSISGGPAFTANGDAQLDDYKKVFGATSCSFGTVTPGTGYLNAPDDPDFYLSGDFTISAFIRVYTATDQGWFQQRDDDDNIVLFWSDYVGGYFTHRFLVRSGGVEIVNLSYYTIGIPNLGADYDYFALVTITRDGNDWYMMFNGIVVDSDTNANAYPNLTGDFELGRVNYGGSTIYASGYIDEFCVVNGTALWSANFDPLDAPFGSNTIDLAGGSTSVDLSNIPQSSDSQVDVIELWRTQGGGEIYFKLTNLTHGTTTYTDDIDDDALLTLELPTDNLKPYNWFDDCYGPWNGSMFWITRSESGQRGRVYYSPIGRAESVQGFIEVTSDSDVLQRIISYAGNLFAISRSRVFQIYGTNPYYSREIPGVPGTINPATTIITPFGPVWESQDGIRIFSGGAQSQRIAYDAIKPIFRGRTSGELTAFSGVSATYARGEYLITDGSQTIALAIEDQRWRDLGIATNVLAYDPSNDVIGAGVANKLLSLEVEGDTDDDSIDIAFYIKTGTIDIGQPVSIELIRTYADTNGETLYFVAATDTGTTSPAALTTDVGRKYTEFDLDAHICQRFNLRVYGSIDAAIEFHHFEVVYSPSILTIIVGERVVQVPARIASDFSSITFESFSNDQDSLQMSYVFERFHYDADTSAEDVTVALYRIGESSVTVGTINTASRTVAEIPLQHKGRFQKLVLTGDFTAAIALRRLELIARSTKGL